MKKLIKKILFGVVGISLIVPARAQLINPYKEEVANLTYLQFPIQKERKNWLHINVVEENLLGTAAKNVIKNDKIANALTGTNNQLLGDSEKQDDYKYRVIPEVFPTDGDLYLEVYVSQQEYTKENMKLEKQYGEYVKNGQQIGGKVSYKVYVGSPTGKKLVYEQKPVWLLSYLAGGSTNSPTGGMLTGSQIEAGRKTNARSWAKRQVLDLYGLRYRTISVPIMLLKAYNKEEKSKAEEMQTKTVELVNEFGTKVGTADYLKEVANVISYYNGELKNYRPGTSKKEATINDKNAWCLYYNLAVLNILANNESQVKVNINKALALKETKVKEITNKKGEKVGEASGMQSYQVQSYLHGLDYMYQKFFAGIKANNPEFVALLLNGEKKKEASKLALGLSSSLYLSEIMGIDVPVDFTKTSDNRPKVMTEKVEDNGKTVNCTIKKSLLYILTKKYVGKMATSDNSLKSKQIFASNILPFHTTVFGLTAQANFKKVKRSDKLQLTGFSKIMYDYNGDIIITNQMLKDKMMFILPKDFISDKDALGVETTEYRVSLKNNTATAINGNTTIIERQRNLGWFSAFITRIIDKDPFETTELSNTKSTNKFTYSGNQITVSKDKKSEKLSYQQKSDDKGNWIDEEIGKIKATRTLVY